MPTRVTVAYGADDLRLEIVDDGPGQSDSGDGAGRAWSGCVSASAVYGGELDAHPRNGRGFVVRARIPLGA